MQTTTALYKQILSNPAHLKEVKVTIAGETYKMSDETGLKEGDIISLSTSGGAFDKFSVGNCPSREINISVFPLGEIPKMAEIKVYIRLTVGTQYSEWLPKGTYYIDTRSIDEYTGALEIHGYDAMLKAEQLWAGTVGNYQTAAVNNIASRIGVSLDSRTSLNTTYKITSDDNYTMREILGYIGASNNGNWIITDDNKLRLIKIGNLPAETSFLIDDNGNALLFGEVRIIV